LYEVGFAAESSWRYSHPNETKDWYADNPPPWEKVYEILSARISHIEMACNATEPSLYFFTGKNNFRFNIAKRTQYKKRNNSKPYHYHNIKAFLKGEYEYVECDGLEADDCMAIHQCSFGLDGTTIICTRDKDLRQVPGLHYGWELGEQPSFGPYYVSGYGAIELDDKGSLKGWGSKFFLAQCIMGDAVDSIPGLPKYGPQAALRLVGNTNTYAEGLQAVLEAYRWVYGDSAEEELTEQGQLLWMCRTPEDRWSLSYAE
jgi:hypothetical protein